MAGSFGDLAANAMIGVVLIYFTAVIALLRRLASVLPSSPGLNALPAPAAAPSTAAASTNTPITPRRYPDEKKLDEEKDERKKDLEELEAVAERLTAEGGGQVPALFKVRDNECLNSGIK